MMSPEYAKRVKKAAPFVIIGLLIMVAWLIIYFIMPPPIGHSTILLAVWMLAGFMTLAIGVYFFLAGDVRWRKGVATGKMMGAGFIEGGLVIMATGLFIYYVVPSPYGQSIGSLIGAIGAGLIMIIAGIYTYFKDANKAVMDERSLKVQGHAGTVAFFLSWALLGILAILTSIGVLQMSYEMIVWVVLMTMPWIFLIIRFVLGRRGESV